MIWFIFLQHIVIKKSQFSRQKIWHLSIFCKKKLTLFIPMVDEFWHMARNYHLSIFCQKKIWHCFATWLNSDRIAINFDVILPCGWILTDGKILPFIKMLSTDIGGRSQSSVKILQNVNYLSVLLHSRLLCVDQHKLQAIGMT